MSAPTGLSVLRRRAEFLAAARNGKKWVAGNLILQIIKTPVDEAGSLSPVSNSMRYGLTASGKIGNAVIRNRARRRLRALAVEILVEHGRRGYDYVLIARVTTATCDHKKLREDLMNALKKLGLWRE